MAKEAFDLSYFDYKLPQALIAQEPALPRDDSRLLIINRKECGITEGVFKEIVDFFNEGDVLVLNDTKVIKARLLGKNQKGGKIEVLLLRERSEGVWEVLVKPGKRARIGDTIIFAENGINAKILDKTPQGGRILQFSPLNPRFFLERLGRVPLPPYIKKEIDDFSKYQTVYASKEGAIAAPTAGLHFTPLLLKKIEEKGIKVIYITLHCSLATFRPVKTQDIRNHKIEPEWIEISAKASAVVNKAKKEGSRIIAVGTTSVRALESVAGIDEGGTAYINPFSGQTNLYITPGYQFKIIDALITNFHTPCSTNLILVSSFCGIDLLKKGYAYAIKHNFRFYSFGDAMFIS
jgi:S-adenosylmethionine:tRNA ribosyltransferase-isomerase